MIINEINIENFRQYRGNVKLKLNTTSQKNVVVIIGSNGAGKTNFSNALNWCLYGNEYSFDKNINEEKGEKFELFNLAAYKSKMPGQFLDVSVEIIFTINNGENYTIKRTRRFIKEQSSAVQIPYDDGDARGDLFVAYTSSKNPKFDVAFPDSMIRQLMPEKIREYFFFDGEQLANYFKKRHKEKIKNAIFNVSQLDVIERIKNRMEVLVNEFQQDSKNYSSKGAAIAKEIENYSEEINNLNDELKSYKNNLEEISQAKEDYQEKYMELGGDIAKKRIAREEELNIDINNKQEKLDDILLEKLKLILTSSYLYLGIPILIKSKGIFDKAENDKLIPPDVDYDFLKNQLEKGKCICGTDISEKTKHVDCRKSIEKLLESLSGIGKHAGELAEIRNNINLMINSKIKVDHEKINNYNKDIMNLTEEIEKYKKERDDIRDTIDERATKGKITDYKEKINSFEKEESILNQKIGSITNNLNRVKEEKKNKEEELKKENEKEVEGKKINKYIDFSKEVVKVANEIKEQVMSEIRNEISKETEKHYKELHWKDDQLQIIIDEDYDIKAIQEGRNKMGFLAAGEETLLTICFIAALNRISGFNAPIFADSALGRIGKEPRENFAKNIAKYLNHTQLTLLFLDSEFTANVYNNLKPSLSDSFRIKQVGELEATILRD